MNDEDLLPSWSDGAAKTAILEFVTSVAVPGACLVPPPERVATFDNDGTLWCEKPQYAQADFVFRRWKAMAEADPAKAREQPYKALVDNDRAWLADLLDHVPDLVKGVSEAYGGITVEAFEQAVQQFFATAAHPTLGVPYTKTGYRPMRELLALLEAHGFTAYICSGGGRDFIRPVAEEMYGIPRERVIGSATTLEAALMSRFFPGHAAGRSEPPGPRRPARPAVYWRALRKADRACCCPARPSVIAVMPAVPGRDHPTDLLLCDHHYRVSRRALAAAGAVILDRAGLPVPPPAAVPAVAR